MKIKRFKTISLYGSSLGNYSIENWNKKTERIVDDSNFIPMSEAVKQLSKTAPLSQGVIDTYYDFPKGKDNGMKPPVSRMKPDLAVLSKEVRIQSETLNKDLVKAQKKAKDKAFYDSLNTPKETAKETAKE